VLSASKQRQSDGTMRTRMLIMIPQPIHVLVSPRAWWNLALIWLEAELRLLLCHVIDGLVARSEVARAVLNVILQPIGLLV